MTSHPIIMGIFPFSNGFGYAVFQGPKDLIDSGSIRIQPFSSKKCITRITNYLEYFEPSLVVLRETPDVRMSRRCSVLLKAIERKARAKNISVELISRQQIRDTFGKMGATNKYQTAVIIREHLSDSWYRIPHPRKVGSLRRLYDATL